MEDTEIQEGIQSEERCFEPPGAGDPDDSTVDVEITKIPSLYSKTVNVSLTVLTAMGFPKPIAYQTLKVQGFSVQKTALILTHDDQPAPP